MLDLSEVDTRKIKMQDSKYNAKRLFDETGVKYVSLDKKYQKVLKVSLKPDEEIEYI